ncbi:alpha/beta fold hydrolase [Singulisphaera acidiphila]|uniref:alpha/beta fold hydrolase n=1 Tax=Singulisphaera acidiphila TaxID=466153 RepID=UPI0002FEF4CC|nr:alpha/beta hydrolase [Singulisphaera acidiphila]
MPESPAPVAESPESSSRPPCPAPADFRAEVATYDRMAEHAIWEGPRYRMHYRVLGQGPPLILVPGIAATYRGYALMLNRLASQFRTVIFDYPGDHPDDGAKLGRITHDHIVDDLFGLIEHLNIGRAFLTGLSFGSTVVFRALHREPRRFPKAVVQGAFAHRRFSRAERMALSLGRHLPGQSSRLPWREQILAYNSKSHFPSIIEDRWPYYLEQNGLTPIAALAHRLDLVTRLDLRPILPEIRNPVLLLQGNEDRIVVRRYFDELNAALPAAEGVIMPLVGHQPHYTHAEALAQVTADWLLPCAPEGCPNEPKPAAGT